MTGWEKVAAATLVAVIGLVALNFAIWRRMRAAMAQGRQTTAAVTKASDGVEATR